MHPLRTCTCSHTKTRRLIGSYVGSKKGDSLGRGVSAPKFIRAFHWSDHFWRVESGGVRVTRSNLTRTVTFENLLT